MSGPASGGPGEPPDVVRCRFPGHVAGLRRYAEWLSGPGMTRGLLGPRETERLWDRHLLNSLAVAELVPHATRLVDLGSGAGLPGLAIAVVRPDLRVDLVESLSRRAGFLTEVVDDLGIGGRVRVVRGRAEEKSVIEQVGSAPFVTARAVAPLDRLITWSLPLLTTGGALLAIKGSNAEAEIDAAGPVLRRGARLEGIVECGAGLVQPAVRVVRVVKL